ncbi:MAG: hypothetical protein ABIR57_09565 [Aeromicrobium sp.]
MGFLRQRTANTSGERMTALVVEADAPLDNTLMVGKHFLGTVRIAIENATPPIYTARSFKLDRSHWLVRGTSVPITIDPAQPQDFELNWEEIPGIEQLVDARDPALCDPMGTQRKIAEVVERLTRTVNVDNLPPELREALDHMKNQDSSPADHFAEALDKARHEPAPTGMVRAVVIIATTTMTVVQDGGGGDGDVGHRHRSSNGKHDAVLSVHIPDREPYAVFVPNLNRPRNRADVMGAGLPALVSTSDPCAVEVLWDELPSLKEQINDRLSEASNRMQSAEAAIREATAKAQQNPPSYAAPAAGAPQVSAEMREMMINSAKIALASIRDPTQRKMMIDQYRLAGITIDEHGNVEP